MSEASFASLGPTLLARKGGAKPAMRPQLAPLPELVAEDQLEDLGWNDMGSDNDRAFENDGGSDEELLVERPQAGADVVPITRDARRNAAQQDDELGHQSPLVHRQQRRLAERILSGAAIGEGHEDNDAVDYSEEPLVLPETPAKPRPKSRAKRASKAARRAAFTLRLDTARHLKLRLAATMQGMSAQALVTEALDAMLEEFDDLDALTEHMHERMKRH